MLQILPDIKDIHELYLVSTVKLVRNRGLELEKKEKKDKASATVARCHQRGLTVSPPLP